jgi:hypothetical protein
MVDRTVIHAPAALFLAVSTAARDEVHRALAAGTATLLVLSAIRTADR